MSLQIRRFAAVAVAALVLTAGAATTATAASVSAARPAHAVNYLAADGFDGYPGSGHERPLRFGPFEFPRSGTISGGFSWGVRD